MKDMNNKTESCRDLGYRLTLHYIIYHLPRPTQLIFSCQSKFSTLTSLCQL